MLIPKRDFAKLLPGLTAALARRTIVFMADVEDRGKEPLLGGRALAGSPEEV